ncbi:MAG: TonB-dependent receptor [bacterium]|nr:MAG: TonB-dependent receptor [bacterium]
MRNKLSLFAILLLIPFLAFAGVTGKISGRVIDRDTGEPLAGANVIIKNTNMGAATNLKGEYFIINVPVGTYTIVARYLGYKQVEKTDVKSIQDMTTTVDFELTSEVMELGETVTVTAERPMISRDATASNRQIEGNKVLLMPKVDTFQDAISLQAGVVDNHIRGGRGTEISYMVDGMTVRDPLQGIVGATINRNAIDEIVLLTGGFSAEYGQAMSGVVNLVTKEGGNKYSGQLRYTTDEPFGEKTFSANDNTYELSFGGPFPGLKKLKFYFSGRVFTTDCRGQYDEVYFPRDGNSSYKNTINGVIINSGPGYKVLDPAGNNIGWFPHNQEQQYSAQFKLTYNINPDMKIMFGGFKARDQWDEYDWFWRYTTQQEAYDSLGWAYTPSEEMLDHFPSRMQKSEQYKLNWTHTLSSKAFYTVNITYFSNFDNRSKRKPRDQKDRFLSLFENWREDYEFVPIDNRDSDGDRVWDQFSYRQSGYSNTPRYPWDNPYGLANVFRGGGDTRNGSRRYESSYLASKWDFVSQVTVNHQFKFGLEYFMYTMKKDYNSLPYDPVPFEDIYEYEPKTGAIYLLDKMEWQGMVINAGLRLDYIEPNARVRANVLDTREDAEWIDADTKWQLSPRLGISHPISSKTVMHFNYGWFFEQPRFNSLYDFVVMPTRLLRRGNQNIGNPDLGAQKTKAWEFGVGHQITNNLSLDVTGYYKDLYDIEGIRFIPAIPSNYSVLTNSEYGKAYGIELSLKKRYSRNFSFDINYTLSWARGTSSTQFQHYQLVTNGPPDPYTGQMKVYPQVDYWLDFDQRHTANIILDYRVPEDAGPSLFGHRILENFGINLLWRYHSGQPYTREDSRGNQVGDFNGARQPWYMRTDARINKDFKLWSVSYSFFCEIENLFNERRATTVYPRTGSPYWDGKVYTMGSSTFIDGEDPEYGANADLGIQEWNPQPYNEKGHIQQAVPIDLNGDGDYEDVVGAQDGIVTPEEYYNAYLRYIHDNYARKTNFMRGRRFWIGFEVYF